MENLFFIVGVGRSGTSLLQSILTSHSKICLPPETGFIRNNILSWSKQEKFTVSEIKSTNHKLKRVIPQVEDELSSRFDDELKFFERILNTYRKRQKKDKVGDKDPRLVEFVDAVSLLFPNTNFIHLMRDPRDVLLSKKKANWSRGKPSWYHIFANYIQLKMGEWQGRKLPKGKYLSITYEELLEDPEETLERVCSFLEVDFEQAMLSFQDKAKKLVSEEEKQWKKETMGPLIKSNTGKWIGKLTDTEIALTELLCQQAFKIGKYQYSEAYSSLSFFQQLKVSITARLLKGLGGIYMSYRFCSQKLLVAWKY